MKTTLTALLLAAALALTLAACGEKDIADTPLPDEPPAVSYTHLTLPTILLV